jgi:hypothetical protein
MHFMEAATLLTAISNAYQVLRANRPVTDTPQTMSEETSPTLILAYDFVRASEEAASRRLESANSRLQALFILAALITIAVPALAAAFAAGPDFASPALITALILFAVITIVTVVAAASGRPLRISAGNVLEDHLGKSEWQFMRDMLNYASRNEAHNLGLISASLRAGALAALLIAVEVVLLVAWLAAAN